MSNLRQVEAIELKGLVPAVPKAPMPTVQFVAPRDLFIDPSYQRPVGERGQRQIRRIIQHFCWTKFKPPICTYVQDSGRRVIKVLDGQHTAIAAASNPHVSTIPIVVVNAPTTPDQAAAFVGQNTEKLGVTALHLYRASLLAGEENAMDVQGVCKRAGIVVLKTPPSGSKYNARETIAITTIRALVRRHSVMGARKILQVLANADLAPIEAMHIKAAELLLTNPEFCNKIDPADLTATIIATYVDADDEARNLGYSHRMPVWHALALVWFRKTRKKRGALRIAA